MPEENTNVGNVSQQRYDQIVAELRQVVEQQSQGQFLIGGRALEIEPMRDLGGSHEPAPGGELFTVRDSLFRLAEDIGLAAVTVEGARWTSSRWPKERRQPGVSFTVHKIFAGIADADKRFEVITSPPPGKARWTADEANRRTGRQVVRPVSPQEKITAIHALAQDEDVAATVTGDLLRRPAVASQVKAED